MSVVCVRMCVWMDKCIQERNVPAHPVSYSLPARTHKTMIIFFMGSDRRIWTILQQGLFELFRQVVCIDTSGSRRRRKKRGKERRKKKEKRK